MYNINIVKEKGFSAITLTLLVLILGIGFYLGTKFTKNSTSNPNQLITKQEASPSAKMPKAEEIQMPVSPVGKVFSTTVNGNSYKAVTEPAAVNFSGYYPIGDYDLVKWNFTLPREGGQISGNTTGACSAKITGNIDRPDTETGKAKATGQLDGKCTPVPRFSFQTDLKSSFEGMVNFKQGQIQITHHTTQPLNWTGSFELEFTP